VASQKKICDEKGFGHGAAFKKVVPTNDNTLSLAFVKPLSLPGAAHGLTDQWSKRER
jgi:hypothetical protein